MSNSSEAKEQTLEFTAPPINPQTTVETVKKVEKQNDDDEFIDFVEAPSKEESAPTLKDQYSGKPVEPEKPSKEEEDKDDGFEDFQEPSTVPRAEPIQMQDWSLQNKPNKQTPSVSIKSINLFL